MTLTQVLAVWFIISVIATPFIGTWLYRRRTRNEFQGLLARSKECERLEKLVQCADEYDAAKTDKERQRIFRKAESLGFVQGQLEPDYAYRARMADREPTEFESDYHPHPKDAA